MTELHKFDVFSKALFLPTWDALSSISVRFEVFWLQFGSWGLFEEEFFELLTPQVICLSRFVGQFCRVQKRVSFGFSDISFHFFSKFLVLWDFFCVQWWCRDSHQSNILEIVDWLIFSFKNWQTLKFINFKSITLSSFGLFEARNYFGQMKLTKGS